MSDRARIIGQMLSAIAVALSLTFLALEVRQNTISTRAQTLQELAGAARDVQLQLSANPQVAAAYFDMFRPAAGGGISYMAGRPGTDHARQDSVAAGLALFALLRNLENVYLQAEQGVVPRDVLDRYDFNSATFTTEGFSIYWQGARDIFYPGFVAAFEEANGMAVP